MSHRKTYLSFALAMLAAHSGCDSSEPSEAGSGTALVGEWSGSVPRTGEFPSEELKLYIVETDAGYTGQLQSYHGDELDEEKQLTWVKADEAKGTLEIRFEGEDEAHGTLTMSADGKTLTGTILYDEGEAGKDAVTLERTGEPKPCAETCLGGFCDMGAGECVTCGDGVECDAACTKDDHCPYASQACTPDGMCLDGCESDDQCAPWLACDEGFCVRE